MMKKPIPRAQRDRRGDTRHADPSAAPACDQPMVITSLQNERIKAVRALEMRKERKATGLFVAEGASVMMMGEEHDIAPELVVRLTNNPDEPKRTQAFCTWAMERGADVLEVTARVLGKLAHKDNPQSLLGVYRQRWAKLPPLSACKDTDLWLALEGVRDPGNLGTIIRTADAVGAAGIILIGTCCDAYTRESVRATMGSIFSVPLVRVSQQEFIAWCKSWPGDVVATHLDGSEDFRNVTYRGPVLLMMGSEGPGLTEALVAEASKVVRIPMNGTLDSLNLAVATALTLYEIRRPHL